MEFCGWPYLFRGRGPDGIDCWGLDRLVKADVFGLDVGDFGEVYAEGSERAAIAAARGRIVHELPNWREVAWEEGATALFRVKGAPVHVGVCTPTVGVVLHAHASTGVTTLDVFRSLKWKDRFEACYLPA